jgi:hypothetical protein
MEQQKLPNSTLVLVMGILSILGCCCYYVPGIIFGIVAIIYGKKDKKLYQSNPDEYTGIGNVNAGYIMGIIGLVLSLIFGAIALYMIFTGTYQEFMEGYLKALEDLQNQ